MLSTVTPARMCRQMDYFITRSRADSRYKQGGRAAFHHLNSSAIISVNDIVLRSISQSNKMNSLHVEAYSLYGKKLHMHKSVI
jgi:hypothetical protein